MKLALSSCILFAFLLTSCSNDSSNEKNKIKSESFQQQEPAQQNSIPSQPKQQSGTTEQQEEPAQQNFAPSQAKLPSGGSHTQKLPENISSIYANIFNPQNPATNPQEETKKEHIFINAALTCQGRVNLKEVTYFFPEESAFSKLKGYLKNVDGEVYFHTEDMPSLEKASQLCSKKISTQYHHEYQGQSFLTLLAQSGLLNLKDDFISNIEIFVTAQGGNIYKIYNLKENKILSSSDFSPTTPNLQVNGKKYGEIYATCISKFTFSKLGNKKLSYSIDVNNVTQNPDSLEGFHLKIPALIADNNTIYTLDSIVKTIKSRCEESF
ncbi:MAG: hypothetical protein K2X39_07880, partial [Silvanigrellaceae bacterium]|nr:hypothetical protein [Silvanigrellaceae bacterium]